VTGEERHTAGLAATVRSPGDRDVAELRIEGITDRDGSRGSGEHTGKQPTPDELLAASLASCTATTIELYARRKGWALGEVEVRVDYAPAQRGSPTHCTIVVRLPDQLTPERRERLMQVGATSPIHRALEGEIAFAERLELSSAASAVPAEEGADPPPRRIALLNGLRGALRAPRT
jgi:putative redox protein